MWNANKKGILVLGAGLALLGGIHYLVTPHNEALADQILALGFCLLLFAVGLASWLSVKTPEAEGEEEAEEEKEENTDNK